MSPLQATRTVSSLKLKSRGRRLLKFSRTACCARVHAARPGRNWSNRAGFGGNWSSNAGSRPLSHWRFVLFCFNSRSVFRVNSHKSCVDHISVPRNMTSVAPVSSLLITIYNSLKITFFRNFHLFLEINSWKLMKNVCMVKSIYNILTNYIHTHIL